MRRNWLAYAVITAAAISVPVATVSATASAATAGRGQQKTVAATRDDVGKQRRSATYDQVAAAVAQTLVGDPYLYGGTSPAGFDCSGLTQYVYRHTGHGKLVWRTAEAQFLQFKPVSQSQANPGDLVFFHVTSDPSSYVYHVGVYEGGDDMVAATTSGRGVLLQSFAWAGDTVTFGTITS